MLCYQKNNRRSRNLKRTFCNQAKYLSAVDALNSSSIVNDSPLTFENCIINELSPSETELIHSPCNTVQGRSVSFLPTAKGHDCAALSANLKVIGLSSSHETTDMPAQQNFSEGASASGCLLSSSSASASRGNTSTGDAPFRLRPRYTKFGIELTVSTTSVAASRNGSAVFERTIALLKQYNLEPDPD
ncbi:hypothetical protein NPIL_525811 [Nephila pilipes]|uniref:Uncharacterized protein n=1 Tax=Nephila pilipes TaxID=299642 RepID=A0A8X6TWJ9_NEPPI|nr:hypothetical protein NPIL_525811 [Nephila pilipes]